MQNLNKFTKSQKMQNSISTRGYFLGIIEDDRCDYFKYQTGSLENVSEERMQEMEVLKILEGLGFPTQEVGTYLFKDMIMKAARELDGYDAFGNPITPEGLLEQMQSPFSQFYVDVARNDLDMGIKTFHSHIERTLEEVDFKKADASLLFEIYSNFSRETDYGEHAFIIAKHIRKMENKKERQYQKSMNVLPAADIQAE